MSNSVLATITTYNPEISLLERNIDAVLNQVDKLIVYENNSRNRNEILELCNEKNIEVVCNDKNYGVSMPLYDGIVYADEHDYKYILTLDQDSIMSNGSVGKLVCLIQSDSNLAIVATKPVTEEQFKDGKPVCENRLVHSVITSGSLADVKKIKDIGNYIPEMFIDFVDHEICWRAIENGYKIMQSGIPMSHAFGESNKKSNEKRFLWRVVRVCNYSPDRCYYIFKNWMFFKKRYNKIDGFKSDKRNFRRWLTKVIVKVILYEENKIKKLRAMKKGCRDGKKFYAEMERKYAHTKIMGDNIR